MVWPTSRFMIRFSGMRLFVEDRVDLDAGGPQFGGQMAFPDGVAAELLAHELLQQQLADRFQRRVGQQQFDAPAAIFHVDAQLDQDGGVGGARDGGKARIGLEAVEREIDRRQRLEGLRTCRCRITSIMRCTSVRSMVV